MQSSKLLPIPVLLLPRDSGAPPHANGSCWVRITSGSLPLYEGEAHVEQSEYWHLHISEENKPVERRKPGGRTVITLDSDYPQQRPARIVTRAKEKKMQGGEISEHSMTTRYGQRQKGNSGVSLELQCATSTSNRHHDNEYNSNFCYY